MNSSSTPPKDSEDSLQVQLTYLTTAVSVAQIELTAQRSLLKLLSQIIECSTLPGDFVLDPCCGSGSTLVAARDTKRTGLGIESDEAFYNTAMSNVFAPSTEESPIASLA